MKVSVIIPTLNEELTIERCVASAWDAKCDEVIVADGGSSDQTIRIVQSLSCTLIETAPGRAAQQNAAARQASGEVLLFLHADNWLAPSACDQIREIFSRPATVCGAFRQRIEADGFLFRALEWGNALRARWPGLPYGDQGIFVRAQAFFEVGGFPAVCLLEDLLLMKRLRKVGKPHLLAGPIYVSPRRWLEHGVMRQTLRNWSILSAHCIGVPPDRLARHYTRRT